MTLPYSLLQATKLAKKFAIRIKKTKGFTLIELLTVITILGMLIGLATVSFANAQKKGRDGKRKTDLKAIKAGLALYYNDNGRYPPQQDFGMYSVELYSNSGSPWITDLDSKYIKSLPKDPLQANSSSVLIADNLSGFELIPNAYAGTGGPPERAFLYRYDAPEERSTYTLWASLENPNDNELATNPNAPCHIAPPTSYNYCLVPD